MIDPPTTIRRLTPREGDVAALASVGFSNREIADRLGLAGSTVAGSLTSVYAKLEVRSRLELAVRAASARALGVDPWTVTE